MYPCLARTLVVGVGNPIRGDDGVGVIVGEKVAQGLGVDVDFLSFSGSALDLLGLIKGYERVVIVDSVVSDELDEGECCLIDVSKEAIEEGSELSSHSVGAYKLPKIAKCLQVPLPSDISWYGIGISESESDGFKEGLSEMVKKRVPLIVAQILNELRCAKRKR